MAQAKIQGTVARVFLMRRAGESWNFDTYFKYFP